MSRLFGPPFLLRIWNAFHTVMNVTTVSNRRGAIYIKNGIKDRGVNGICMLTKNPIKQDNISSSQTREKERANRVNALNVA